MLTVRAPGSVVQGITVDGAGGSFDRRDAAIYVNADDVRIEGTRVINAVFGILVERAHRAQIIANHVRGDAINNHGMRGDTVRLWEAHEGTIAENLIEDGRDLVVWYSSDNKIYRNRVLRGRYGMHFMYSHRNLVHDNAYVDTIVGIFVMYSRQLDIYGNLILNASGASGIAVGLKDSGAIDLHHNVILHNTTGIYVDDTPQHKNDHLRIHHNILRQHHRAVVFHSTPRRTLFEHNDLVDNVQQVAANQGAKSEEAVWRGNYFDDYAGYDLDGDGFGDLPHEVASASEDLVAKRPELGFLRGALALGLVDVGSRLLPVWKPRPLMIDEQPRMSPQPMPKLVTVAHSSGLRAPEIHHED